MAEAEVVLHRSIASRSITALWMLEELGLPYRSVMRDLKTGGNRAADYLALNPTGKVPTLEVGGALVSENPAICIFLADRYGYGGLSPRIEDAERGAWLKWIVFATSVFEPARALAEVKIDTPPGGWGGGWVPLADVTRILEEILTGREYLVGERFTAADVMLGSTIAVSLFTKVMERTPAVGAYNDRLVARPAFQRARALNWPPELFG